MALKTIAFLLTLNILFFSLVSSDPALAPAQATCPRSGFQLGACAGLLNNLGGVTVGAVPTEPCCSIFYGLANFEAAVCLCNAVKTTVLGVPLEVVPSWSLVLNNCGKEVPSGFEWGTC